MDYVRVVCHIQIFSRSWFWCLDVLVRLQLLDGPADAWNNCIVTLKHSALHLHKGQSEINDSYFLLHAAHKSDMLKFHRTSLQDSWRYGCFKPSEPSLSLSLLITRVIVSQSQCLLTLISSCDFIYPNPKSAMYGTGSFFTTAYLLASPLACIPRLARTEVSHILFLEQSLGWLLDCIDFLNFVQWTKVQIMVLL